jgi:hypothetical protein
MDGQTTDVQREQSITDTTNTTKREADIEDTTVISNPILLDAELLLKVSLNNGSSYRTFHRYYGKRTGQVYNIAHRRTV